MHAALTATNSKIEHTGSLAYFIQAFSFLAFLSLTVFGVYHVISTENIFLGYLEVAAGFALILNILLLRLTNNVLLTRTFFLVTLMIILLIMLVTGGIQATGIFWFFTFPAASFFLTNKKQGVIWCLALMAMVLLVFFLSEKGITSVAYRWVSVRQMIVSLGVLTVATYLYQNSRELFEQQAVASQTALTIEKEKLLTEKIKDEAILESIGEGLVVVDKEGRIMLSNRAAKEMLGLVDEEVVGKYYVDMVKMVDNSGAVVPPDKRPSQISLREGKKMYVEANYMRSNGDLFPVGVVSAPLIFEDKVIGAVFVFRDITEEKKIDRAKSEFVTLASHQLRTPITAISWLSEMLLSSDFGTLSDEQKNCVKQIHMSNTRMANLINELLIVSRLEMQNFIVKNEALNLTQICEKILYETTTSFSDKNLSIVTNFADNLPAVPADPYITKIIIQNVVVNAFKYTQNGGSITITLQPSNESAREHNKKGIILTVQDTGYGIPKFQQKDIFTKLFRSDNIKQFSTDGTGLGLFIVKEALEQVGGEIWFESEEGKGSTFHILFPGEGMIQKTGEDRLQIEPMLAESIKMLN